MWHALWHELWHSRHLWVSERQTISDVSSDNNEPIFGAHHDLLTAGHFRFIPTDLRDMISSRVLH